MNTAYKFLKKKGAETMDENIPKYLLIVNWVKEQLEKNNLKPGDKLNSENELSSMFGVSRQTVRHAVSMLEQEKILDRRRGSGTYICEPEVRKKSKTMNVAVVTTYIDDYIFPTIIKEIERAMSKAGYTVQIAFTHNHIERESAVLQNILDRDMVDGIIIEPTKSGIPKPNLELYEEIRRRHLPAIFINSYYPKIRIPHVSLDDQAAGYEAARYLLEAGHEKIAGIFKSDDIQGHLRYSGYTKGLLEAGLKIHDENVLWIDTEDIRNMEADRNRILRRLEGCTACLCYNDEVAFEVVKICQKEGIRVPEDMSVIGIDNSDLATHCEVPLTSIELPAQDLGRLAAENLIKLMEDSSFDAGFEFVPKIVERNSVKKV
ncbi:GntR family transcriptional regulator [Anaerobium acetethylicum]|nr:GntR family transcriptional regulator [Anaerobium acetethylicum]